jgi:hypothetical protein
MADSSDSSSQTPSQRLQALKSAADNYFSKEQKRLQAQYDFLNNISQKRGGSVGLQSANAQGASDILANSINDYLGSPLGPNDDS